MSTTTESSYTLFNISIPSDAAGYTLQTRRLTNIARVRIRIHVPPQRLDIHNTSTIKHTTSQSRADAASETRMGREERMVKENYTPCNTRMSTPRHNRGGIYIVGRRATIVGIHKKGDLSSSTIQLRVLCSYGGFANGSLLRKCHPEGYNILHQKTDRVSGLMPLLENRQ